MKKLKHLKHLHEKFVEKINELDNEMNDELKKIKMEYQQNVIDEKVKLLLIICNGEGLDFNILKKKYLKTKEINSVQLSDNKIEEKFEEEILLDTIKINDKEYFYEQKEGGNVFDIENNIKGIYINGSVNLTKQSIK